jgi:hypothetical protein
MTSKHYSLRSGANNTTIIDFSFPIPTWAHRKISVLAQPTESTVGLFAYRIANSALSEELSFLQNKLWLYEKR